MAILNLTPDSFSGDGLAGLGTDEVVAAAERAVAEGADLLDLGAESTRPGHAPVSAEEELARLLPALAAVRPQISVPISVDTARRPLPRRRWRPGPI
jgi:dihydropteroate synthase